MAEHRFPSTGSLTIFHFCTFLFSGASLAVHDVTRADGALSHKPAPLSLSRTSRGLQLFVGRVCCPGARACGSPPRWKRCLRQLPVSAARGSGPVPSGCEDSSVE